MILFDDTGYPAYSAPKSSAAALSQEEWRTAYNIFMYATIESNPGAALGTLQHKARVERLMSHVGPIGDCMMSTTNGRWPSLAMH